MTLASSTPWTVLGGAATAILALLTDVIAYRTARVEAQDARANSTGELAAVQRRSPLPENQQRELIADMTPTKHGPNTITSKKALLQELDAVLGEDFAVNDEELAAELYAIATPVRNEAREVVAAINLAGPNSMISLEEMVDALSPHLVSTADRISARLGYRRDDEKS